MTVVCNHSKIAHIALNVCARLLRFYGSPCTVFEVVATLLRCMGSAKGWRGTAAPCVLVLASPAAPHMKFENCGVPLRRRRCTCRIRLLSEVYRIIGLILILG